ncbi:MAG: cytochrome c oxidase accessory protein CcoG [Candidatus Cloacimonadota bacterium]|nr:MAG: cytochrome c oxidase accessory protein CcoG [Candidatus Cloacimonadota bacterium]
MENKIDHRNRISTIDKEGGRKWIYAKAPKGFFTNLRNIVAFLLILILVGVPFLKINGNPLFMFNFPDRIFFIFGIVFWPQDLILLLLLFLSGFISIFLFTSLVGRIWCGWACPQTIFMENVFRKIEYFIEGGPSQQKKLNKSSWSFQKIIRKSFKHITFFSIAFCVGNLLLAWIIGVDKLYIIITDPPSKHTTGLTIMLSFAGFFYFIFSWFREQACVLVCPYARLQSVLLDDDSIVVSYDFNRGEDRKSLATRKKEQSPAGSCIDCNQCVVVCPMGIDIRNGIQLECVNCTACIDACENVMQNVSKEKSLIGYTSLNKLKGKGYNFLRNRTYVYSTILIILLGTFSYFLYKRPILELMANRQRGAVYQILPQNKISNHYIIQLFNKSLHNQNFDIKVLSHKDVQIIMPGSKKEISSADAFKSHAIVIFPKQANPSGKLSIEFAVTINNKVIDTFKTNFLVPMK